MSLDGDKIKNKMMTVPPVQKAFHFSGDGIYRNMTIVAGTREEATREWLAKRQPVEQSTPAAEERSEDEVQ